MNEDKITLDGIVIKALSNGFFSISIEELNIKTIGYVSGKMRKNFIRILEGDRVKIEIYKSSPNKGRIIYRY